MELNENTIKSAYKLMEMNTKGYHWYHDTPEQPFEYENGSIWLINPETKKWMLQLGKSGNLLYYYKKRDIFSRYINMQKSDFELFIKMWVEDVLKNGISTTASTSSYQPMAVEDVLKNGVSTTKFSLLDDSKEVEDVLKNGKKWN